MPPAPACLMPCLTPPKNTDSNTIWPMALLGSESVGSDPSSAMKVFPAEYVPRTRAATSCGVTRDDANLFTRSLTSVTIEPVSTRHGMVPCNVQPWPTLAHQHVSMYGVAIPLRLATHTTHIGVDSEVFGIRSYPSRSPRLLLLTCEMEPLHASTSGPQLS